MNDYTSCVPEAIDCVLALDLSDVAVPVAVQAQASLLAHIGSEELADVT